MKVIESHLDIRFIGFGTARPKGPGFSNADLLKRNPATKDWGETKIGLMAKRIEDELGFKHRYFSHFPGDAFAHETEESTESLALEATKAAVGARVTEIEAFVHGTTTSRRFAGSQAASIMGSFGHVCPAYETKAGCSTSLAALHMGQALLKFGYKNVLVSGAETLSKVIDPARRDDWFGLADGAASIWMENSSPADAHVRVLKSFFSTRGEHVDLYTTSGILPPRREDVDAGGFSLRGDGLALGALSKKHYVDMLKTLLPTEEERRSIRWIVPHQVSRRLIDDVVGELKIGGEILWSADRIGNIGGSSILYTLSEALEKNTFKKGDRILLASVGGGLSFAGQVWEARS